MPGGRAPGHAQSAVTLLRSTSCRKDPADILTYVDGALLVDLWEDLVLPRAVRSDVYVLAHRFGEDVLLARVAQIDAGFDANVHADMIASLDRFTDDELPMAGDSSAADLRAFYAAWRSELTA